MFASWEGVRQVLYWCLVAFLLGVIVVGQGWLSPPHKLQPAAIVAPQVLPKTAPPVVEGQASGHARVVIERPVFPPGYPHPVDGPAPTAQDDPGATYGPYFERIVIDTGAEAAASAPVVVVTPAGVVAPDTGLPIGLTVGTFPGQVALDWRLIDLAPYDAIPLPGLEGVRLGMSVMASAKCAGISGTLSLAWFNPRLYLSVGEAQPYQWTPDPAPFVGVGWRF